MNRSSVPKLTVVVLAAGFATRLGRSKALARVRGESLLRRTARLAAALRPRALVIVAPPRATRYRFELARIPAQVIVNRQRASGMASSVRAGLQRGRWSAGVLFLPVDLATLRFAELSRLVRRWRASPRRVVARRLPGAPRAGIPLILPKHLYAAGRGATGDVGLRVLIGGLPCGCARLLDMPSARDDVDTPAELASVRGRRFKGSATARGGTPPLSR